MNRIEKLKKIIIPAFIFFIFILLLMIYLIQKPKKEGSKTEKQQATFDNIIPGISNKKDLVDKLGDPIKSATSSAYPDEFKSTSSIRNTLAFYDNEQVVFIKEVVTLKDNKMTDQIIEKYGAPPYKLYGPDSSSGYYLFVYPDIGIAYLGHQESGIILEIWYFQKTTLTDFISKYAKDYSLNFRNIPQQ